MQDDRTVLVRHPASMILRRKRHRHHEHRFVSTETPVILKSGERADLGEAYRVVVGDVPLVWRVYQGALWYQVAGVPLERRLIRPWSKFGPEEFVAFLEGAFLAPHAGHVNLPLTDLYLATLRTPLACAFRTESASSRGVRIAGPDAAPHGIQVAEIRLDGRAKAASDLARFMDERVRIVGEHVLVRTYEPLLVPGPEGWVLDPFPQTREEPRRGSKGGGMPGHRPDIHSAGIAWELAAQRRNYLPVPAAWGGALASAPYGPDTARLVAMLAVTTAMKAYRDLRDRYGFFYFEDKDPAPIDRVQDIAEVAWEWEARATTGALDIADGSGAVEAARALIEAVADCYANPSDFVDEIRDARLLIRRFAEFEIPMLGQDHRVDDMNAIGALAP